MPNLTKQMKVPKYFLIIFSLHLELGGWDVRSHIIGLTKGAFRELSMTGVGAVEYV
jgi:hypothetical protein